MATTIPGTWQASVGTTITWLFTAWGIGSIRIVPPTGGGSSNPTDPRVRTRPSSGIFPCPSTPSTRSPNADAPRTVRVDCPLGAPGPLPPLSQYRRSWGWNSPVPCRTSPRQIYSPRLDHLRRPITRRDQRPYRTSHQRHQHGDSDISPPRLSGVETEGVELLGGRFKAGEPGVDVRRGHISHAHREVIDKVLGLGLELEISEPTRFGHPLHPQIGTKVVEQQIARPFGSFDDKAFAVQQIRSFRGQQEDVGLDDS